MKKHLLSVLFLLSILLPLAACTSQSHLVVERNLEKEVSLTFAWDTPDDNKRKERFIDNILIDTSIENFSYAEEGYGETILGYIISYGTQSGNYDRIFIVSKREVSGVRSPWIKIKIQTVPGIKKYYFTNKVIAYYPFEHRLVYISDHSNEIEVVYLE